jgi:chromosome segregation ATPase
MGDLLELLKAAAESPSGLVALLVILLIIIALTGLKVIPMITQRFVTVEIAGERRDDEEAVDTRPYQLLKDRLTSDLLDRIEDRGKRLHEVSGVVNKLVLQIEKLQKELDEMKRKFEKLEDQHATTTLDFVELRSDVRHMSDKVSEMRTEVGELREQVVALKEPITAVATWVANRERRRREAEDTP